MNIDYNIISAWAAIVAAIAAVVALWIEGRRSRFSHGLDIVLKLDEVFHSKEEFRKKRRAVARLLKSDRNFERGKQVAEIEDILNHFEMLGLLLRKGVLDKELVWAYFFVWLHHYYSLLKPYIAYVRRWEPTAWEDVDWLHQQLAAIERKHRPKGTDLGPSEERLREFLDFESNL